MKNGQFMQWFFFAWNDLASQFPQETAQGTASGFYCVMHEDEVQLPDHIQLITHRISAPLLSANGGLTVSRVKRLF